MTPESAERIAKNLLHGLQQACDNVEGVSIEIITPRLNVDIVVHTPGCEPYQKDPDDVGYDLRAEVDEVIHAGCRKLIPLGVSLAFPPTHGAFIFDKSGVALKQGIIRMAGVIEGSYRDTWAAVLYNSSDEPWIIKKFDRVCQVVFLEITKVKFNKVTQLPESARGTNGFGSSGVK